MRRIYYLSSCSTCQRILKEWSPDDSFDLQDIKNYSISEKQLDQMIRLAGSAEALFSRVAMKYRALGLGNKQLTENDYRNYILQEYTFLKRPVLLLEGQIFIGNSKSNVALAKAAIDELR